MIAAEGAWHICRLAVGKSLQIVQTDKGLFLRFLLMLFLCRQSHSDSAHESRIRSSRYRFSDIFFQSTEHCIVFKSSALNYNLISQRVHIGKSDHLGKYIFYNGAAETGHNILRQSAVSLFRDNAAVHKHRAPAAKNCRVFG